jgi:hypothetical protein
VRQGRCFAGLRAAAELLAPDRIGSLPFRWPIRAGPCAPEIEPQRNRWGLPPDARRRYAAWSHHEPSLPALRHQGIFAPAHARRLEGAGVHVALEFLTFGRPNVRCTRWRGMHQVSRVAGVYQLEVVGSLRR